MQKLIFFLCVFLTACQLEQISEIQLPPSPIPTDEVNSWQELAQGLEQSRYRINNTMLYALRIDPKQFDFRVHYHAGEALDIQEWHEELPDAVAIVNANFFTSHNTVLGLLVSDNVVHGQSYTDRGGTFFVQDGNVGIRSNLVQPYLDEAFEQAIQAFPMLVLNGTQAYMNERDTSPSRRTIIGQDNQGRIIIIVSSILGISLYDLSNFLASSDMEIVNAFNLDGGGSTMLYFAPSNSVISSFDPVPAVLAVYPQKQ